MIACRRKLPYDDEDESLVIINANTDTEAKKVLQANGLEPNNYTQPFTKICNVVEICVCGARACWKKETNSRNEHPYAKGG